MFLLTSVNIFAGQSEKEPVVIFKPKNNFSNPLYFQNDSLIRAAHSPKRVGVANIITFSSIVVPIAIGASENRHAQIKGGTAYNLDVGIIAFGIVFGPSAGKFYAHDYYGAWQGNYYTRNIRGGGGLWG